MSQICSAMGAAKRVMGGILARQEKEIKDTPRPGAGQRVPHPRGQLDLAPRHTMIRYSLGVSVANHINIVKLCVGADTVEDLLDWQRTHPSPFPSGERRHITRMWPKREAEVLAGGSLYWVVKGVILCRQRILRLDEVIGSDGIRRCGLVMDPEVVRTEAAARRPFQGWRYLAPADSPRDLPKARGADTALPDDLALALAEIGLQ